MTVEPLFDFETGEFVFGRGGAVRLVSGKEELKNRICKLLHTPRGKYRIYEGTSYGNRLENLLVGKVLPRDYLLSEAERYVREDIGNLPDVTGIDEFAISKDGSRVTISFRVNSVWGTEDFTEVLEIG